MRFPRTVLLRALTLAAVSTMFGCTSGEQAANEVLVEIRALATQEGQGAAEEPMARARQLIALCTQAIRDHRGTDLQLAEIYAQRGNARLTLDETEDALRDLSEAVRLAPESADYWGLRAYANGVLDRPQDAIADLGRVLTISPDDTRANANRAVLRERIGDLAGAISDYTVVLARDPEAADLLGYRADLRVRLDDLPTAVEDYVAAIRVTTDKYTRVFGGDGSGYDPTELDLRAKLAKVYERQGNTDAALREYETILSLNERHPDGLDGRARLRVETKLN